MSCKDYLNSSNVYSTQYAVAPPVCSYTVHVMLGGSSAGDVFADLAVVQIDPWVCAAVKTGEEHYNNKHWPCEAGKKTVNNQS